LSGCQYGKDLKEVKIESDALFGHPADTNLGQARDATPALHRTQCGASESRYRYLRVGRRGQCLGAEKNSKPEKRSEMRQKYLNNYTDFPSLSHLSFVTKSKQGKL